MIEMAPPFVGSPLFGFLTGWDLALKGEKQGDKLSQQISTDLKFPR